MYVPIVKPSFKDYKWVIQSSHIKYCTVMVQDIDVDHSIWVKSVPALKGNAIFSLSV